MSPACHVTSLPVIRRDQDLYPGLNEPISDLTTCHVSLATFPFFTQWSHIPNLA